MQSSLTNLRRSWSESTLGTESTFHQLAPYIGKLKSRIASSLIRQYSKKGDTIFEPFSGSGVVPLEALMAGRGVIANDLNPYAAVLTQAKIFPIPTLDSAIRIAQRYVTQAKAAAAKTLVPRAPAW